MGRSEGRSGNLMNKPKHRPSGQGQPTRPAIITGPDGLPRCADCREGALCPYHRHQVGAALAGLQTATMLSRADCDVRYMLASRRWGRR